MGALLLLLLLRLEVLVDLLDTLGRLERGHDLLLLPLLGALQVWLIEGFLPGLGSSGVHHQAEEAGLFFFAQLEVEGFAVDLLAHVRHQVPLLLGLQVGVELSLLRDPLLAMRVNLFKDAEDVLGALGRKPLGLLPALLYLVHVILLRIVSVLQCSFYIFLIGLEPLGFEKHLLLWPRRGFIRLVVI